VYYQIDNGTDINVDREEATDKEKYETSAEFEGWTSNATMSVRLFAEARYYFVNNPEKFSNTVEDTEKHTFSTDLDPNIGAEEPLVEYNYTLAALRQNQLPNTLNYALPYPVTIVMTPGFEMVAVVLAIVATVLLFKYKKNKKKT